jgi:hypothetical protein
MVTSSVSASSLVGFRKVSLGLAACSLEIESSLLERQCGA